MVREETERQFGNGFGGSKVGGVWGKGIRIGIHGETSVVIEVERPRASRRTRQQQIVFLLFSIISITKILVKIKFEVILRAVHFYRKNCYNFAIK